MISANAVLPMCLIMALGYGTRRLGWIRREEISAINKIAFRIFLPCLLYYNVYCSDLSGSFDPLLMAYAVGGVLLTFGLSLGYTLLTEKLPERRGVMIQGMFRSNYVIMGIPVATALLGADQLGTVSILIAVVVPLFNMLAIVVLEVFRGQKPKPRKRRHREKAVARPNQGRREEPVTFGGGGKGRRHRPCTIQPPAPTTAGTPRPAAVGAGHIFAHAGRVVRGHCMARTASTLPPGDCAAPPQCAEAGQLFQEE